MSLPFASGYRKCRGREGGRGYKERARREQAKERGTGRRPGAPCGDGGALAGRRLRAPRGAAVRPTSDRVRESVFARLPDLDGARGLDLFSGTGALGIEALSRGAASAAFVERARPALACLEENLAALGLAERTRVVRGDVLRRSRARARARASTRADGPPYGAADAARPTSAFAGQL